MHAARQNDTLTSVYNDIIQKTLGGVTTEFGHKYLVDSTVEDMDKNGGQTTPNRLFIMEYHTLITLKKDI